MRTSLLIVASVMISGDACRADEDFDKARDILQKADSWELLSLNADLTIIDRIEQFVDSLIPQFFSKSKYFHDWPIRGKTPVRDVKTRMRILDALDRGVNEIAEMHKYRQLFGLARLCGTVVYEMIPEEERGIAVYSTGCFQPRHAIIAEHNGRKVELLICFQCSHMGAAR